MILYRGPLSSCNYACRYCPFAKNKENRKSLARDKMALLRFVEWVREQSSDRIGILFTPWGEALIRRWYREAIIELSHIPHVAKVAIQTNLSCHLDWLEHCHKKTVALWTTFHPTQVKLERFLVQCQKLDKLRIRYSVGIVGLKEHKNDIALLRCELKRQVYFWINAYKEVPNYYTPTELDYFKSIDLLFDYNLTRHKSKGRYCYTGKSVVTIDGEGNIYRCHFIKKILGNIYTQNIKTILKSCSCPNQYCDCYLGYVHIKDLGLYEVFGEGILERCPVRTFLSFNKKSNEAE